MELFRKYLKALGKKGYGRGVNGYLACFCLEHFTGNSYNITNIHFFECFVWLFPNAVTSHV